METIAIILQYYIIIINTFFVICTTNQIFPRSSIKKVCLLTKAKKTLM